MTRVCIDNCCTNIGSSITHRLENVDRMFACEADPGQSTLEVIMGLMEIMYPIKLAVVQALLCEPFLHSLGFWFASA